MAETDPPGGLDYDPAKFEILNGLWFIEPARDFGSLQDRCLDLLKLGTPDGNLVAAFTDKDLARRYIERAEFGRPTRPYHPDTPQALQRVLLILLRCGYTTLAIDPEPSNVSQRAEIRGIAERLGGIP
jgi:hypothetical protein